MPRTVEPNWLKLSGATGGWPVEGIATDYLTEPPAKFIYIAQLQAETAIILRAKIDGTGLTTLVTLAGKKGIQSLGITETHLYWITYKPGEGGKQYVGRCLLDGTEVQDEWIGPLPKGANYLTVSETHIYWGTITGNCIGRCTLAGGSIEHEWVKGLAQGAFQLVYALGNLYWATEDGKHIGKCNASTGGELEETWVATGAPGARTLGLVLCGGQIYFAFEQLFGSNKISRTENLSGNVVEANVLELPVDEEGTSFPEWIGTDGDIIAAGKFLYWANAAVGEGKGVIGRIELAEHEEEPEPPEPEPPLEKPLSLGTSEPSVAWDWFLAKPLFTSFGAFKEFELIGQLVTGQRRHLDLALDAVESASFSVNTLDAIASQILPVETCIVCYRNNILRWSGPVWTVNETVSSGQENVDVTCVGWFQLLLSRILKTGKLGYGKEAPLKGALGNTAEPGEGSTSTSDKLYFNEIPPQLIAFDLLRRANYDYPTGITPGTFAANPFGAKWNVTYNQFQNIGQAIQQLANTEAGFDFRVDPSSLAFNVYYNLVRGSVYGRGIDRTTTVFGYGAGPANLASLQRTIDGASLLNHMIVQGQFGLLFGQDSAPSIEEFGLFEGEEAISATNLSSTALESIAAAEVVARERPLPILTFSPMAFNANTDNVPQPFEDYDIGDFIYLLADYGRMQVPVGESAEGLPVRVYAMTIDIDDEGNEMVSNVQTVYQNA